MSFIVKLVVVLCDGYLIEEVFGEGFDNRFEFGFKVFVEGVFFVDGGYEVGFVGVEVREEVGFLL